MLWSAIAGGFLGTLVLTTVQLLGGELGITRMDLPFMLGTTVTDNRYHAKVWGYVFHFMFGLVFALAYAACFRAIGHGGLVLGMLVGALHAVFAGTVLVTVLLPVAHPRIGTPDTAADEIALIEPPGFLLRNYGRNTFLVTLLSHVIYGAIVGWAVRIQ